MRRCMFRYGYLLAACAAGVPALAGEDVHVTVNSRVFELVYDVSPESQPLESVRLWYTTNAGETWQDYGYDEDRQSPMNVQAPTEGSIGLFLVLGNSTGMSSKPPTSGTRPHQSVYVDYTPPVVQLHELRQVNQVGQRLLQIRWTALDANLIGRPIELAYRQVPDRTWHAITSDRVADTGRFDWRVPRTLSGTLEVRVTAMDKGGNIAHSKPRAVELVDPRVFELLDASAVGQRNRALEHASAFAGGESALATQSSSSRRASARAARLYADGVAHRDRNEYRRGIARLREAIRLDPQLTDAFAEMAGMLYLLGDTDKALSAYELALTQQPTLRKALQGAARVYRQKHDYRSAADKLRTILRYNPNDAEIWMNLGDIAVYQGDEILARECYTRATRIDPDATEIIDSARKRLALMREVSRTYKPTDR